MEIEFERLQRLVHDVSDLGIMLMSNNIMISSCLLAMSRMMNRKEQVTCESVQPWQ
jgi:hypothetical protein